MILFSLNPIQWIKDALVSDYVGAAIRHALTAVGFYLILHGYASEQVSNDFVNAAVKLLTSKEFLAGLISVFTGGTASIANKKVP